MGKAYDEIMEQVEVTEEMQARILSNIRTQKIHREKKILRYRKPLAYAAAGLLLIMVGVSYLPKVQKNGPETESEQFFVGNGIEECSSIETLSGKVGFLVEELSGLPFTVDHTEYLSYWGDMAEIDYQGADETACYRKSKGEEDNSGDYNEYAEVRILRRMVFLSRSREKTVLTGWRSGREAAIPILSVWKREPMRLPS